jgi:hypothetical protein
LGGDRHLVGVNADGEAGYGTRLEPVGLLETGEPVTARDLALREGIDRGR